MQKFVYDQELHVTACMLTDCTQRFPQHYHNYYTIGLNLKGSRALTCCYDKKITVHILSEGKFMMLNPFAVHQCRSIDTPQMTYCSISVPTGVMNRYIRRSGAESECLAFLNPTADDEILAAKFLEFQYHMLEKTTQFFNKNRLFNNLMDEIVGKYAVVKTADAAPQNLVTALACNYIAKNYHKNFTVEEMCRELNIKNSTLFLRFHKEFGITPQRYIMNRRIIAAKELLKTEMPISSIAISVGFYDHRHFTNFFKRIEGITPQEYCHAFSPHDAAR